MEGIRVVIVDVDASFRRGVAATLSKQGYLIIGEAEDGLTALKLIRARQPDLIIMATDLPVMDGLEVARIIEEDRLAPVVLMTPERYQELLQRSRESNYITYLVKPFSEQLLLTIVDMALINFERVTRLQEQVNSLREALETRKTVEKAKGILMQTLGISEEEAYRRMRSQSMNRRKSLKAIAQAVILSFELNNKE